jgi:uncharacterized damage-inducible protein DinB
LSQSDAVQTPLESSPAMSIAGLVSHLRWSEAFWIDVVFLGRPNQWPGTDDDSELQMRRGLEQPLTELLDEYAKQAAHTDDVIAARDWDAEAVGRDENTGKPFALRYIITHLIAETARHNGHLDILRELADGIGVPAVAMGLFACHYYYHHVWSWDLLAVGIAAVPLRSINFSVRFNTLV